MTGLTSLLLDKIDSYCPPITNDVIQQNSWHFEPQGSKAQASIIFQVTAQDVLKNSIISITREKAATPESIARAGSYFHSYLLVRQSSE